ncbi:MAG: hypothetical protein RJB04_116, partial [Verrucomicrobiota bacterium]
PTPRTNLTRQPQRPQKPKIPPKPKIPQGEAPRLAIAEAAAGPGRSEHRNVDILLPLAR